MARKSSAPERPAAADGLADEDVRSVSASESGRRRGETESASGAGAPASAPAPCRHLLVVRTSAMGDVAMLSPRPANAAGGLSRAAHHGGDAKLFRPFFAGLDVAFLDVDLRGEHRTLAGMWRLAAEARRLGVDAVADVHDVLRSKALRLALRLHGIPVARIRKGRAEKRRLIRCGATGAEPLRHTVLRYCDVFRRLGFDVADPAPAVHPRCAGGAILSARKRARGSASPPSPPTGAKPTPSRSAGARAAAVRALRPGVHSRRRGRRAALRRADGGGVSQRHGALPARCASPGRSTSSRVWTAS